MFSFISNGISKQISIALHLSIFAPALEGAFGNANCRFL